MKKFAAKILFYLGSLFACTITGLCSETIDNSGLRRGPFYIELYVNNALKARVKDIATLPSATFFGSQGQVAQEDVGLLAPGGYAVLK